MMMVRTLFMSAALMLAANVVNAQITTYIAPPRPPTSSSLAVATADSARKDSTAQATMSDMKAWVDSASGVQLPATVGRIDSVALSNDPGRPVITTTLSDGSVAPATASSLPTLVVAGVVMLAIGAALIATKPRG